MIDSASESAAGGRSSFVDVLAAAGLSLVTVKFASGPFEDRLLERGVRKPTPLRFFLIRGGTSYLSASQSQCQVMQ